MHNGDPVPQIPVVLVECPAWTRTRAGLFIPLLLARIEIAIRIWPVGFLTSAQNPPRDDVGDQPHKERNADQDRSVHERCAPDSQNIAVIIVAGYR